MNYLIGDIGNTNIKICKLNKKFKIIKTYFFSTKNSGLEINFKKKLNILIDKNTNSKILISSVVPNIYKLISKTLKKKRLKVYEIKKLNLKKLINIRVDKYSDLGSDRIANAIGAYHKFKSNCIVIDFGTATTFDVVKKNAIYDGGVIAPGIKLSIENLFSSTALLPMFKLNQYPKRYGKNTIDALSSGFFWGYEGLINNIIKKIIKKNGISFKIVLTGGYSYLFKNRLIKKATVENDITMQGIIKIYKDCLK
tara:strand:- start:339 stop:1097 length:759 start_codon:yes stop_codon:yes gene_type:complete